MGERVIRLRPTRGSPSDGKTALVNHWFSHAVGHLIEALRRCQGYHAADPTLRLGLVLNGASPVELVSCAPFVSDLYAVPYTSFGTPKGSPRASLRRVPRDWDYVVHHPAATNPEAARFEGLGRYYDASRRHFRARIAVGIAGQSPPPYVPHQELRLVLPEAERSRALAELGGRRSIAVMPSGSGARFLYPSVTAWLLVLDELERRFPDAVFTFVGRVSGRDGRTVSGITRDEVNRLIASRRAALDVFDRSILAQLAAVEASGLLVSPHTGFAFAGLAVGTPWLTLSGGDWHEYFFNGVPFYSILPKSREHPTFVRGRTMPRIEADEDGEGPRAQVMSLGRVQEDLGELGDAAERLARQELPYAEALADYFPRLLDAYGGDRSLVGTFDDLDLEYL
jgi:hypothetical protein